MAGVRLELLLEFGIILLAPLVHQAWLWRKRRIGPAELRRSALIFGPLYGLLLLTALLHLG